MNRRSAVGLVVTTALGLAFLPDSAISQQKSLKDQLIGAWTLVSSDTTAPNGTKRQDFGANPKGILILDASGRYALVQGRPDRPKFKASNNVRLETPAAEFGEAARAFVANFGTWFVNEAEKTLIRRYEGALIPNAEGAETKVSVTLAGDELKLTATNGLGESVYRRAEAWRPLAAPVQQPALPVIGFLNFASSLQGLPAFRQGLAAEGFIDGQNVAMEFRYANGQMARLPELAAELVRRRVSVIVAINARNAVFDAKSATETIPIVFMYGGDPVRDGFVASLNRPGSNLTGVTRYNSELGGKRLSLLLSLVPQAKTIAFLKATESPRVQQPDQQDEQFVPLVRAVGREVVILAVRGGAYEAAFKPLIENPAEAMVVGNFTFGNRNKIIELAARYKIPAIYPDRSDAVAGGLMSYSSRPADLFRMIGAYAGRILKGQKPADLPVQQPTNFEFVINLKTAKELGLTIPPELLAIADEVIE
jgi:putative tryptophan/tyrosine transport system substrate-binding protein